MDRSITQLYVEQVVKGVTSREQIAKNILSIITECETTDASYIETLRKIKAEAQRLV